MRDDNSTGGRLLGCGGAESTIEYSALPRARPIVDTALRSGGVPVGSRGMSLSRQGRHYLLIGGVQWLLDWAVMVALSHWGMPVEPANVVGRISGAMLGFWLNGRITFAGDDTFVGRRQFLRFVLMWVLTTVISTWSIGAIDDAVGLKWTWLAKPGVELVLGGLGFLLSRHWVYRR